MLTRAPFLLFIALVFTAVNVGVCGETSVLDAYEKQASKVSQKRFEQKSWSHNQQSDLMDKSFPFQKWDSHYSSLGSKRAGISTSDSKEKERFKTKVVEFKTKEMDLSRWDGRMAELERQAQISTDQTSKRIQDKRLYQAVMQQSDNFAETGETLSLRDINRFQFRQNRSDSPVPVQEAGIGDDSWSVWDWFVWGH